MQKILRTHQISLHTNQQNTMHTQKSLPCWDASWPSHDCDWYGSTRVIPETHATWPSTPYTNDRNTDQLRRKASGHLHKAGFDASVTLPNILIRLQRPERLENVPEGQLAQAREVWAPARICECGLTWLPPQKIFCSTHVPVRMLHLLLWSMCQANRRCRQMKVLRLHASRHRLGRLPDDGPWSLSSGWRFVTGDDV